MALNKYVFSVTAGGRLAKAAKCEPSLTVVNLAEEARMGNASALSGWQPNDVLMPPCVRVQRCSGCCGHALLACQPSSTTTHAIKTARLRYDSTTGRLKYAGEFLVPVEEHQGCECGCAVNANDCAPPRRYRQGECRCSCGNHDERKKCEKHADLRLWDPKACRCACRGPPLECTTGLRWDDQKCWCVKIAQRRRFARLNATKSSRPDPRDHYELAVVPIE